MHLAAGADDLEDLVTDRRTVAVVLALQLAEGGGVEVEPFHADAHLVGPEVRRGVEPECRLRQHPGRLEDPVHADRIALDGSHVRDAFL